MKQQLLELELEILKQEIKEYIHPLTLRCKTQEILRLWGERYGNEIYTITSSGTSTSEEGVPI